jgi:hypothetical protein
MRVEVSIAGNVHSVSISEIKLLLLSCCSRRHQKSQSDFLFTGLQSPRTGHAHFIHPSIAITVASNINNIYENCEQIIHHAEGLETVMKFDAEVFH